MARRGRGEGSIYQRRYKDKVTLERKTEEVWSISYYDIHGNRHREYTGHTDKQKAQGVLNQRIAAAQRGLPVGAQVARTTFEDLAKLIVDDYEVNGNKSAKRLDQALVHLKEAFGGLRAYQIDEERIGAFKLYRKREGAAAATINYELAALKRMFRLGKLRVPRVPEIQLLKLTNRRKGFFEPDAFALVRAKLPAELQCFVDVLYITGWRTHGEVAPMLWDEHVDFTNGFLRLEDSKNGEPRMFPFTPALRAAMETQRRRTDELEKVLGEKIPHVWWRLKGPGVRKDGQQLKAFRKTWISACVAAGLGEELRDAEGKLIKKKGGRIPHDFRRTAIRNFELAAVDRSNAKAMVGHKTDSVYNRYAIANLTSMRTGADKLADLHGRQDATVAAEQERQRVMAEQVEQEKAAAAAPDIVKGILERALQDVKQGS